jgi:hypothetical protein
LLEHPELIELPEEPLSSGRVLVAESEMCFSPGDDSRLNNLYQVADRRLYSAKHADCNRIVDDDGAPTELNNASAPKGL